MDNFNNGPSQKGLFGINMGWGGSQSQDESDEGLHPIPPASQEKFSLNTPSQGNSTQGSSFSGLLGLGQINSNDLMAEFSDDGMLDVIKNFREDDIVADELPGQGSSQLQDQVPMDNNQIYMIGSSGSSLSYVPMPSEVVAEAMQIGFVPEYPESLDLKPDSSFGLSGEEPETAQVGQGIGVNLTNYQARMCSQQQLGSCSEVSSSQESNREIPATEIFPGKYNFRVFPEAAIKICQYSERRNKLYCLSLLPVRFNIGLDYGNVNIKSLTLKAMLVFKSSAHAGKLVERCVNCKEQERGKNQEVDENLFVHVLRSTHAKAAYYRSPASQRYYVATPMEKPQAGSVLVSRAYRFMCLSSCKGINRKELSLVFTLMEKTKVVGRHSFDLKVCSCPFRDCEKDENNFERLSGGCRASTGNAKTPKAQTRGLRTIEQEVERAAQRRGLSPSPLTPADSQDMFGAEGPAVNVIFPPPPNNIEMADDEGQEQEDNNLSQNTAEVLMACNNNVRFIMAAQKDADPNKRRLGEIAYTQLRTFFDTAAYLKDQAGVGAGAAQGQGGAPMHPGNYLNQLPSPDSGVGGSGDGQPPR